MAGENKTKRISYGEYRKKRPNLVVMYSRPDYVEAVTTPDQLKQWTKNVMEQVGIAFPGFSGADIGKPLGVDDHNHTNTGWIDADRKRNLDFDCDYD